MNESEEKFNEAGFKGALEALSKPDKLTAIQKAAKELVDAAISVCYSKLSGDEHKFCFVVHAHEDVDPDNISKLMSRLTGILSYDEVSIQEEALLTKPRFELQHSSLVPVSSKNYEGINTFLKEYDAYLRRKLARPERDVSPELDNFVEALRTADPREKENLLRRLSQRCDEMGIRLDVQVKRLRMEGK